MAVQNNVDEAVEKLKAQGVEVLGLVCHVSNAGQRKNLIDTTVQVIIQFYLLSFMICPRTKLKYSDFSCFRIIDAFCHAVNYDAAQNCHSLLSSVVVLKFRTPVNIY